MRTKVTAAAMAVVLTLSLTSCKSLTGTSADPDPRLQEAAVEVKSSSYAIACLTGAAIGALGCLATGNDDKNCFAVAAVAGCGVGLAGNALLDNLRKDYAEKEQQLDALIAYVDESNKKAALMAKNAEIVYKERHNALTALLKRHKQGTAEKKELEQQLAQYDADISVLKSTLKAHEQSLDGYRVAVNGISGDKLSSYEKRSVKECDRKIASLESEIAGIRKTLESYTNDRDVLNLAMGVETKIEKA